MKVRSKATFDSIQFNGENWNEFMSFINEKGGEIKSFSLQEDHIVLYFPYQPMVFYKGDYALINKYGVVFCLNESRFKDEYMEVEGGVK